MPTTLLPLVTIIIVVAEQEIISEQEGRQIIAEQEGRQIIAEQKGRQSVSQCHVSLYVHTVSAFAYS